MFAWLKKELTQSSAALVSINTDMNIRPNDYDNNGTCCSCRDSLGNHSVNHINGSPNKYATAVATVAVAIAVMGLFLILRILRRVERALNRLEEGSAGHFTALHSAMLAGDGGSSQRRVSFREELSQARRSSFFHREDDIDDQASSSTLQTDGELAAPQRLSNIISHRTRETPPPASESSVTSHLCM